MKKILFSIFLVLTGYSNAQPTDTSVVRKDAAGVVHLSASSSVEVAQDWLTVTLVAQREDSDPAVVQRLLKKAVSLALDAGKDVSVKDELMLRTAGFSVAPRYGATGRMNGWIGSAEVVIEGRDFAAIAALAGRINAMVISGTRWDLSPQARRIAEGDAQAAAIERFKVKSGDVAKSFGFSGYELREVNVSSSDHGSGYPRAPGILMAKSRMSAADSVPVEAGKSNVTVTVSGSLQLRR
jgi:predicted secreted protein